MKKNDLALLILIVSVSLVVSYFIGRALLGSPEDKSADVESAQPILAGVVEPSDKVFNTNAINPTVPIRIGEPSNQKPFGN